MMLHTTTGRAARLAPLALWLGLAALLLAARPGYAQSSRAIAVTVDAVYEGATLDVTLRSGQQATLRLAGIEVPGCVRDEAIARLQGLTWGRVAFMELDQPHPDAYGLLSGYLRVDGVLLNLLLVADGLAVPSSGSSRYATDLSSAGDVARAKQLGVWSAACRG